eukprot:225807-Amphidinium_carterae.1
MPQEEDSRCWVAAATVARYVVLLRSDGIAYVLTLKGEMTCLLPVSQASTWIGVVASGSLALLLCCDGKAYVADLEAHK